MIRKFVAVALAAGVMFGTAGCNMISHVATNDVYAPSDGAQVDVSGLHARNFLLLTDGTKSILIGSLVNGNTDPVSASLSYEDGGAQKTTQVNLNGAQKFDLGYNGTSALPVASELPAGAIFKVTVAVGSEKQELRVPVLDGTLPEYKAVLDANQ